MWTDTHSGLRAEWHLTKFSDFPAVDWVLYFENTGTKDTPVIANMQAMDLTLDEPLGGPSCYRLHKTNGAPANPTDFEPSLVELRPNSHEHLGGGGGRSSNKDFPFVKIESSAASYIVAVGWSGQWAMDIACRNDRRLHVSSGLELTHFKLHPGERVRTPRILVFRREGDTLEANARFRELIYQHYAARRNGKPPLPTLFCNTCFTRGGGWLNECNAENQISLIRAYAPLGLEALVTDAGWFEGSWPAGAGNWNPRKDAYPQGMGPVAAAAKQHGMVYGLWYEFERVVAGTPLVRLDDRSFHSTMATSLIPGWIADEKGFDAARAKKLADTYRRLRHLLVGGYYPLTPYSRDGRHWMGLQFHRPDLGEGLVLVMPPRDSADRSLLLKLHELAPVATYEVQAEIKGQREQKTGAELMKGLLVALPTGDGGERIVYRKLP
jgi:hypothetical protein